MSDKNTGSVCHKTLCGLVGEVATLYLANRLVLIGHDVVPFEDHRRRADERL